jgi:tRNA threonylcarbamoyladenosine biosynthesis protein TsaB
MLVLAIDICGQLGTVALVRLEGAEKIETLGQTELPGKTYSARLVPTIRELLATHHVARTEIATIVVTNGPGGFTGIRIGLSTAKGLAEPESIPILAVSRLAVLARKAGTTAAALDASRGEFYFGDYSAATPSESLLPHDAFAQRAAALGPQLAVCEPAVLTVAPWATRVDPPTAADALHFALPRLSARDFDDPLLLDGNYLRRSDAEIFSKPGTRPGSQPAPHK